VDYLQAGASFGVSSLLLGEPHDTTIEAKTDLVALVLYRSDFSRLLQQNPGIEEQLAPPDEVSAKLSHEHLDWLTPGEVVIYHGLRHWFVFAQDMVLPTLGLLALGTISFAMLRSLQTACWGAVLGLLLVSYVLVLLWRLMDWRNDYFVVTTQRVVRRELVLLQHETRLEAPLNRVQNVTINRSAWGNILGFGDAVIETAAQAGVGRIVFDHLRDPEAAKDVIFKQIYRTQARLRTAEGETVRAELKRRLQWATSEELAAQGELHRPTESPSPPARSSGWLARLGRIRLLPPLRLEEHGQITWRKHWLFLLGRIWLSTLAALALLALFAAYVLGHMPALPPASLGVVLGALLAALVIGSLLWWQVVDWENDVYIVTEDRLIDVEKKPLFFAEQRRETTLDRVQNVNLIMPSLLATVLDFGDVNIETAGGEGTFTFTHVAAPRDVQREIMSRVARQRERRQQLEAQQRRRELADWFAAYESLRAQRQEPPAPPPTNPEPDEPPAES
ncbi:MAG TPA: PH domain-containing protein, partial [Anaerolineae bacterium]|nr:PH domain-containing protein [Anaerolineae bacterium]